MSQRIHEHWQLAENYRFVRGLVAPLLLSLSFGCSGGGSDGGNGFLPANADAALRDTTCYLDLDVGTGSSSGFACSGTDQSSTVSRIRQSADQSFEPSMRVDLVLDTPPALGALSLTELSVDIPDDGGQSVVWDAPVESCTATAVDSKVEPDFGWTYFRIDVSCSAPAVPAADNPGDPLDLGDFTLVTFFDLN